MQSNSGHWLTLTCILPVDNIHVLSDEIVSLKVKSAVIKKGDRASLNKTILLETSEQTHSSGNAVLCNKLAWSSVIVQGSDEVFKSVGRQTVHSSCAGMPCVFVGQNMDSSVSWSSVIV